METRSKNLRGAQEAIKEKAQEWGDRAKTAGSAAMEKAQAAYGVAQERTIAGAKATDQAIRQSPYIALGAAFGIGLAIGLLARRKN